MEFPQSIFGPRVLHFDPSMNEEEMQARLDALHAERANAEFTEKRTALLFMPGEYSLDVTVDYYVQALGLGRNPGDVVINGTVESIATTHDNRVTTMFWRGAENITVVPTAKDRRVIWAVSQAAPFRRMHVKGNLQFDLGGWASGGLLANSIIEGWAGLTTGQQWFTRNSELGSWLGGNWNRTFMGSTGTPVEPWPKSPNTVIEQTPLIREKPYLCVDEKGEYGVFVPALQRGTVGVSWGRGDEHGDWMPLEMFFVADPDRDNAASLNHALAEGRHLFFTPGIYRLDTPLVVAFPDTVILGIGLPTLIPTEGNVALQTADVGGIKIAGLVFDAGPEMSPALLQIGEQSPAVRHEENPTSLHDIYCRVGGMAAGRVETCIEIHSHNVVGDHFWLWRADHGEGIGWSVNEGHHGLVVHGDDVTVYGLFVEHYQSYQTLWLGERGRTYFYQSEIPYDPPDNELWNDEGQPGFASYKVADTVDSHQAWGLGIYSFFEEKGADGPLVVLQNAIEAPLKPEIAFEHITLFSGRAGWINHVINDRGPSTKTEPLRFIESLSTLSGETP